MHYRDKTIKKVYLVLASITITLSACNKCDRDKPEACHEDVPGGITCQAYWESWVYNENKNTCEQKVYSACGMVGFATKEKCESCIFHP